MTNPIQVKGRPIQLIMDQTWSAVEQQVRWAVAWPVDDHTWDQVGRTVWHAIRDPWAQHD